MKNIISFFVLSLFFVLVNQIEATAKQTATTSIITTIESCGCGNGMASFTANYNGKQIAVGIYYGGKTILIKNGKIYKDWFDIFCPKLGDEYGPLSGKKVRLEGKWDAVSSGIRQFSAYKVYVLDNRAVPDNNEKQALSQLIKIVSNRQQLVFDPIPLFSKYWHSRFTQSLLRVNGETGAKVAIFTGKNHASNPFINDLLKICEGVIYISRTSNGGFRIQSKRIAEYGGGYKVLDDVVLKNEAGVMNYIEDRFLSYFSFNDY